MIYSIGFAQITTIFCGAFIGRRRDLEEHKHITEAYMGRGELLKYRTFMALTLAPLRRAVARNRVFSGAYHWLKGKLYGG